MNRKTNPLYNFISFFAALLILSSVIQPVFATSQVEPFKSEERRAYHAETGKLSFLGADPAQPVLVQAAQAQGLSPEQRALAMVEAYGRDFGLNVPSQEVRLQSVKQTDERETTRYQQVYKGIPVLGGELIVNATTRGGLLSINGEVSPGLTLDVTPSISAQQAQETALGALAKWNQLDAAELQATEPDLWIYDSRLLGPDGTPPSLVWRMEVTPLNDLFPLRELVLVDAQRGHIALHFNQVDTLWQAQDKQPIATAAPAPNTGSEPRLPAAESAPIAQGDVGGQAATWYVATTGDDSNSCSSPAAPCATINGAIGKAASGDTIYVASGTYTGTTTNVVAIDKSIMLSGSWNSTFTSRSAPSIIDGQNAHRGVYVHRDITATIDSFNIQNGDSFAGAGVQNDWATLTITNCLITNNQSDYSYGDSGGGIWSYGTLIINNSTITNNLGDSGGGIKISGGTADLNNITLSNNISNGSGGGIYINSGTVSINNSALNNNTSKYDGGGIYLWRGNLTITNSTISENKVTEIYAWGGGVLTFEGNVNIFSSTISRNHAWRGGGLANYGFGTITIANVLLALNRSYSTEPDCLGQIISGGYNLVGNSAGCTLAANTGDLIGNSTNIINPFLNSLQDNGGTTFTHALGTGSPAIDAGNPATPGSGGNACPATDQRGMARPVGTRCDIGAYEGSVPWVPEPFASTYTANSTSALPGAFRCDQNQPNCTNGADPDADAAHRYALGTYNFYVTRHLRDSIDNSGMTIVSTVDYCSPGSPCPYANAFWNGAQMVYGDGYPLADDVVAHELTHGVTQYESNLFYYYQSGAINESFSDIWGELYDQSNGLGTDTPAVKWLIGEDAPGGAIRSMSNPPLFGDPDAITSPLYFTGWQDNGGVHYNSGVSNKVAFLMVDGGTFNGKTVTALGAVKTLAIYYEVQTRLLTSGADYADLYHALYQACLNLIGSDGITTNDCQQVRNAADAVALNAQPISDPNFNTDAPFCDAVSYVQDVFFDDFENGLGNHWMLDPRWTLGSPYGDYAHSGSGFLFANDYPAYTSDASAILWPITIPPNAYLHFSHAYGFEFGFYNGQVYYFDGGVLEYSTNNGVSWQDAAPLIVNNGYKGTIYPDWNNPLKGRAAFVGESHGYISTRLNLSSLAGQNVSFRWRMALDDDYYYLGWFLDDVRIYTCPWASWVGGVSIESDQPVVTVGRPHIGTEVASYIGANAGDTTQYVPMLFKSAFGGGYNAALYVQNISNASANLTMEFTNSSGAVVYTKTDTLAAKASKGYWLPSESGLPSGFAGGVKVTSTQPITALGRPHINGQVMTYNSISSGSTTTWLPMFFKNGFGNYNTAIYVQNVTSSSADLTIQFLNLDGTVACQKADSLAANASKGYWSLSATCDTGSLPMGFVGGVKVTSTENILAVGRAHLGTQITTYNGFASGAPTAYVPMLFRNAFANGSYKAALYLQNVSGSSADVTIEYVNDAGAVAATQNVTLASGAISSIWLPGVAGLPDGFVGGARISSTQDIVAVGRPHLGSEITAYNGTSGGSTNAYLPMLFKNAYSNYQSAFYIQNTTGNTATVDISFYNNLGALSCIKTISLAPNATQGFWMPSVSCAP